MLDHKRGSRGRRLTLRLGLPIATLTSMICLTLYLSFPWLIARVVPTWLEQNGFSQVSLNVGYPGWHGLSIDAVHLRSDRLTLEGAGFFKYSVGELLSGEVTELVLDHLSVSILPPSNTTENGSSISPEQIFLVTPLQRLRVQHLRLEVPEIGFISTGSLDLNREELSFDLQGIEPVAASHFHVAARLLPDATFSLTFTEQNEADADYLTLLGMITDNNLNASGGLQLSGYGLEFGRALLGLPPGNGHISAEYQARLPWPLPDPLIWQDGQMTATDLNVAWRSADSDLNVSLLAPCVVADNGRIDAVLSGNIAGKIDTSVFSLQFPEDYSLRVQAGQLEGTGAVQIKISENEIDLLTEVHSFTLTMEPTTTLNFDSNLTLTWQELQADGKLSAQLSTDAIERWSEHLQADLEFDGVAKIREQKHSAGAKLTVHFSENTALVEGSATTDIFEDISFNALYNLATRAGELRVNTQTNILKPLVKRLVPGWAEPYDLEGGRVAADLSFGWPDLNRITGDATIVLQNGRAHYDVDRASGMNGSFRFNMPDITDIQTWSLDPTNLTVAHVDIGFPISDLSVRLAWSHNQVNVLTGTAAVLGGQASVAPFVYDLATDSASFELALEDLDLAAVLALEGEDISGSGRLTGSLPVRIANNVASVQGGKVMAAAPGGIIRLSPALAGGTGQPGLDFALVALQDLRYSKLERTSTIAAAATWLLQSVCSATTRPSRKAGRSNTI
ncbi:MAG: YdbH domain-containing protein [Proteobacteria bacterium]|nr:YdbH domain-containing protein [Pseudomonadota bacterium]